MGDIVNLRRARKHKARQAAEAEAETNRILHGTPRHRRQGAKAEKNRQSAELERHRLNRSDSE